MSILAKTFQQLPPLNQLSALSVATRPDRVNQSVSLLQYFESESIPADLGVQNHEATTGNREYYLTISKDRLQEIKKVKMEGLADQKLEVARDILVDMAKEAASELGRMFEYQVALVNESIAMRLLARHAVNCVLYMVKKRNRILDRNSIVIGAVRGRPKVPEGAPKFISVIIGSKELKWNLYEIFKKSALRKELLPNTALVDSCCSARWSVGRKTRRPTVPGSSSPRPSRNRCCTATGPDGRVGLCERLLPVELRRGSCVQRRYILALRRFPPSLLSVRQTSRIRHRSILLQRCRQL